jgi:amidohydrolase
MDLITRIKTLSNEVFPRLVEIRRDLHKHPELSFNEFRTSDKVKNFLSKEGIPFKDGIAGTGITADITGFSSDGSTIGLRADMDALPIHELSDKPYCSVNNGIMHACGHDFHTSSLMGTAWIANQLREYFSGSIRFIFQPAEEKLPGGAKSMIAEGVLKNPDISSILGQHVTPFLETGKVGIRSGNYMASTDEIYLEVIGKGGHGAQPHLCDDPIALSAQIITALQQIVSRKADPRIPSVLTFGKISGNGATNIIPDSVYIEGTFRTFDENWRKKAHSLIRNIISGICESSGFRFTLDIKLGYPVLKNDPALTSNIRTRIQEYVGFENTIDLELWMAAEDFAWYTHEIPGCFYRIGTGNEAKKTTYGLHTPSFDVDENALQLSSGLMAWLALNQLNKR